MMSEVLVDLATATICFMSSCYPALVGAETPTGVFHFKNYSTSVKGYGGNILSFKEGKDYVFAVHRVINVPGQNRHERLKSGDIETRKNVTAGCVNVSPDVFEKLVNCCSKSKVIVK